MYAFVSHLSAVEGLRAMRKPAPKWPAKKRMLPIFGPIVCTQKEFRELCSTVDLSAFGFIRRPVDLIVPSNSYRRKGKNARFHVWKHEVPVQSMYRLNKHIIMSGPELTLIQLAGYQLKSIPLIDKGVEAALEQQEFLDSHGIPEKAVYDHFTKWERMMRLVRLATIAMEFAGTYRIGTSCEGPRYDVPPLTTFEDITHLCDSIPGFFGASRLHKALDFSLPNSASPMETSLVLILTLPLEYGGFNLPKPELNVEINVSDVPFAPTDRNKVKPDLLWQKQNLIIEYESSEFHMYAHPGKATEDSTRANLLTTLGYSVLRATPNIVLNLSKLTMLAKQAAEILGVSLPEPTPLELHRREKLHTELFSYQS